MAIGYPDYTTLAGRSIGGRGTTTNSFQGTIAAESNGTNDLPAIVTGTDRTIQGIGISVPDDEFIHKVQLFPTSTNTVFFEAQFVRDGLWSFSGEAHGAGTTVRIKIFNNSDAELTFTGEVFWTTRDL